MKTTLLNLGILFLILIISSCQKEEINVTTDEEPILKASLVVENNTILLEAGRKSFYHKASYILDTNDVYIFTSQLSKDNFCKNNCQEFLQIKIRSNQTSNGQLPNLEQSLKLGSYHLAQATDTAATAYQYTFKGSSIGTNQVFSKNYTWLFSSEIETSSLDLSAEEITFQLPKKMNFDVQLKVVDAYGAKGEKQIKILTDSYIGISMNILGNANSPILIASKDPESMPISSYSWKSGNTTNQLALLNNHDYDTYCVTGKNSNGFSAKACGEYAYLFGQNIFCAAQINWSKEKIIDYDNLWLSGVTITYSDKQGEQWSTFLAIQSQETSKFEVTKIADFKINEVGQKTKIITANFTANFTNGTETRPISGTSTFAVGLPE